MKRKIRKYNPPISVVKRYHPFVKGEGPDLYVDPLFADKELEKICQSHPVEALEGELKARVWANSEVVIKGISHKTWLLTEEYLHPHPMTNDDQYYYREYICPVILRDLYAYLYPKYIKCNLAQFTRIFCFDGNNCRESVHPKVNRNFISSMDSFHGSEVSVHRVERYSEYSRIWDP